MYMRRHRLNKKTMTVEKSLTIIFVYFTIMFVYITIMFVYFTIMFVYVTIMFVYIITIIAFPPYSLSPRAGVVHIYG